MSELAACFTVRRTSDNIRRVTRGYSTEGLLVRTKLHMEQWIHVGDLVWSLWRSIPSFEVVIATQVIRFNFPSPWQTLGGAKDYIEGLGSDSEGNEWQQRASDMRLFNCGASMHSTTHVTVNSCWGPGMPFLLDLWAIHCQHISSFECV